ncbi:MAG: D-alanyl-D-alanine carboxypeptidase [Maricaulaceae bacterium]|nr:D-alanyl-D-alanine carboxypeptidase [Maricaulaceae bacterium]
MLAAFIVAAGLTGAAAANPRYAAFVADADTGEVLHARNADALRYPASLTKAMTLYMLFEAIEQGRTRLDAEILVSLHAANQEPSRLGLSRGDTIRVEDAIRALVVRSANDVAAAVAEHLSGSETAFARAMTERARELGLTQTSFRNASGLPDPNQRTTARDMARLAVALRRDFPQHYHYFSETRFQWDGRTWRSHNGLVGRVSGVDGLKTGYIRASGFNVMTTAQRDGRRIVAVVMGGPSAASRDSHAEELIEAAYDAFRARAQTQLLASLESPRLNPMREQALIAYDVAALDLRGPSEQGSTQEAPPLRVVLTDADALDDAAPLPALRPLAQAAPAGGAWAVQVGAYGAEAAALARLESVASLVPDLSAARQAAQVFERDGRRLWRARFEALSADAARGACAALAARGEACFAVAPDA